MISDSDEDDGTISDADEDTKRMPCKISAFHPGDLSLGGLRTIYKTKADESNIPRMLALHPENRYSLGLIHPKARFSTLNGNIAPADENNNIQMLPQEIWLSIFLHYIIQNDKMYPREKARCLKTLRSTCKGFYGLIVGMYTDENTGMVDVQKWYKYRAMIKEEPSQYAPAKYILADTDHYDPIYPVPWHMLEITKTWNTSHSLLNAKGELMSQFIATLRIGKSMIDTEMFMYLHNGWTAQFTFDHHIILHHHDDDRRKELSIWISFSKNVCSRIKFSARLFGVAGDGVMEFTFSMISELRGLIQRIIPGDIYIDDRILFKLKHGKSFIRELYHALHAHRVYYMCGNFNEEFEHTADFALRVRQMKADFAVFKKQRAKMLAQKNKALKRLRNELL